MGGRLVHGALRGADVPGERWPGADNTGTAVTLIYSLSSSVSRTYSITRTVGVETTVQDFLTATVSNTIVNSVTTAIGVTNTTTVPPRTRLAEYGIESYQVRYMVEAYRSKRLAYNKPPPATGGQRGEAGYCPQNGIAATHIEGRRLRA